MTTTKTATTTPAAAIALGAVIRSYDFEPMPDRGDCYLEGRVFKIENGRAHFVVLREVFAGRPASDRVGTLTKTPLPGRLLPDWQGRVSVIEAPAAAPAKTVTIAFDGDEYRVPGPDGREATAYYTNDLADAYLTADAEYRRAGVVAAFAVRRVDVLPGNAA